LCFMHEDILYKTENWGPLLLNFFKNYSDVGCIGILGGNYMPKKPGYILDTRIMSGHYLNHGKMTLFNSYMNQGCTEVVALDGVWFCIPKYLFELISFDEINYSGFHFYDMDISMQVRDVGYKVMVMDSIYIEHNNVQRINGM
ncbi:MAG TPA: glycosyltransferase, partial [Paludibacteraceae bacterium]|nr:glycosyltransferase [Paludibacteraceae bacterium]